MERQAYGLGGELQRLVARDPQEPQGFYPVTKARSHEFAIAAANYCWKLT